MRLLRLCALGLVAVAVACSKDTGGTLGVQDPVAGFRYVNLVPDLGPVDFRVVDIIGDAPNAIGATFRTGGAPYGVITAFLPPHLPVRAGTRTIRVFRNHTHPDTASIVVYETTFDFVADNDYTLYMYGYSVSPANGTPALTAQIVQDNPTDPGASISVRVIHLAPTLSGSTLAAGNLDVFVDTLGAAVTPTAGTALFTNVAFGDVRTYSNRTPRIASAGPPAVTALNYRAVIAATGTTTPFIQADVPNGVVGTSTANPIAGDLVAGTSISAVIVPRSTAGSPAPQTAAFAAPTILFLIDRQPPRTAP